MIGLRAAGISLNFQPRGGVLAQFTVLDAGRHISPLHKAPWVGELETMPEGTPPHIAWLAGDFFCAPFGKESEGTALHGWPANANWLIEQHQPRKLTARLGHVVQGATVQKHLQVRNYHPFVYQTHTFIGGEGTVPVANHANVSVPNGATISTSRKRVWETPADPQESDPNRGRSQLLYPAQSDDLVRFPGTEHAVNLAQYPWGPEHEDFVMALDAEAGLGWTAVVRPHEGDLFLSLRNAGELPMTMLWHSNAGRDYAPWSSRHTGCLGVEEGAAAYLLSCSSEADLVGPGALTLGGRTRVRHVIGAVAWSTGEPVADAKLSRHSITISGAKGTTLNVPLDTKFLFKET